MEPVKRAEQMRIGLDFDNTIVSYDTLFHRAALEKGLIPAGIAQTKLAVRDYLRAIDREDDWTELQGFVYGARMAHAEAYPGVMAFMREARRYGVGLAIVSHKTQYPFRGPKYDLHDAARAWVAEQLVAANVIEPQNVYFELTKDNKLKRVCELAFDYFIDDLPEILTSAAFPTRTTGILFDADCVHPQCERLLKFSTWPQIMTYFQRLWMSSS